MKILTNCLVLEYVFWTDSQYIVVKFIHSKLGVLLAKFGMLYNLFISYCNFTDF